MEQQDSQTIGTTPVSTDDVLRVIRKLKLKESLGPDRIPADV